LGGERSVAELGGGEVLKTAGESPEDGGGEVP
jgi:hypothetical protein